MTTHQTLTPDELWLAGCRGKALGMKQQENCHYAEGQLVRSLIHGHLEAQREQKNLPMPSELTEQQHWQRILGYIRQEGMFASEPKPVPKQQIQHLSRLGLGRLVNIASNQHWFALVASVGALAVGVSLFVQQQEYAQGDDAIVMRGVEDAQRIAVGDGQSAQVFAEQIEAVLQRHKLPFRRMNLDNHSVQIQAKVPLVSPARRELETMGVVVPAHERVNLLLTATP